MRFLEDLCRRLVLSDELLTGKTLRAPRLALATQSITTSDDNLVPQTSPYFEPQPANYPPIAVSVSPGEHLSSMVRTAYDAHLSEHHTWAVRKAVQFAVYVLPSRESLVRQIIEVHAGTCLPAGLLFDELPSATTAGVHIADGQTEKPAFEDGLLNSTSNSSPPTEHVQSKSSTSSPSQITEADVLPMMLLTCDLLAEIYGRVQRIFERHQLLNLP